MTPALSSRTGAVRTFDGADGRAQRPAARFGARGEDTGSLPPEESSVHRVRLLPRVLALGLVCSALVMLGVVLARPVVAVSSTENAFALKINSARAAAGLPPLRVTSDLTSYARSHSAAMMGQGALFHTSNWSAICCWTGLAENVGTGTSVAQIHAMFMASPGHRANILDRSMRQVGVGVVRSASGQLWVTEIFRAPTSAAPSGWLPSGTTATATTATARPTVPVRRAAARASRSQTREDPVRVALARLTAAAARTPARQDPVAQALGWSSAMRTLTAAR